MTPSAPAAAPSRVQIFFSLGFRPFFLAGALWACVAVFGWLPQYFGEFSATAEFSALDWHAHEALFGFIGAVIGGFLLTAIPNWTGAAPLRGRALAALVGLWLAGRIAVAWPGLPIVIAAAIDGGFLIALLALAGRDVMGARNWRNLRVLGLLTLLAAANFGFHFEAALWGDAALSRRAGLAAITALVMLIGGRIIPAFTRNALMKRGPGRLPAAPDRIDDGAMALSLAALALWSLTPRVTALAEGPGALLAGALLLAAAAANFWRLSRWAGWRARGDRLVLVLHVAFGFIPLGLLLSGLAALDSRISPSAGLHGLALGVAGLMTLAVMSRASLGHTGRALVASRGAQALYVSTAIATLARIGAALAPQWSFALLHVAAFAWLGGFGGFALLFGPMLLAPRAEARP